MAGSTIFYTETLQPWILASGGVAATTITLTTTAKQIATQASFGLVPVGFWYPGKAIRLDCYFETTSGATPGNFTIGLFYGNGDNAGVSKTGAAIAFAATQTSRTIHVQATMRCRTAGTAGTAWITGRADMDKALITATTYEPYLIPQNANATVAIDTTVGTNAFTIQALNSGANASTTILQELNIQAVN
jgi:hypothetical protein